MMRKLEYQVTLWDHFGLNKEDMKGYFYIFSEIGAGFMAWFLLQHFFGYKPFITKVTFSKTITGKIKNNKL